jgi:hypothetical protein
MFKSKTVFVVGAGASAEAELPVGNKLTAHIASLLDLWIQNNGTLQSGDKQILQTLKQLTYNHSETWNLNRLLGSGRQVAAAMGLAPSIDTFLQTHRNNAEYVLLGKMGIAKAIIDAENNSKLARTEERSQPFKMASVKDTWYISLAQQLFSEVPEDKPELAFQNVSFIIFNYDRCLQVFLIRALELYFQIDNERARKIIATVEIVHPYGNLGDMDDSVHTMPMFGSTDCDLYAVSQRLKTFSESEIDAGKSDKIRGFMSAAETLIFLGFAFYDQNMELLGEDVTKARIKPKYESINRVYATTYGMSDSDVDVARAQIGYLLRGRAPKKEDDFSIETFKGTCHSLFAEYWKSLTASAPAENSEYNIRVLG